MKWFGLVVSGVVLSIGLAACSSGTDGQTDVGNDAAADAVVQDEGETPPDTGNDAQQPADPGDDPGASQDATDPGQPPVDAVEDVQTPPDAAEDVEAPVDAVEDVEAPVDAVEDTPTPDDVAADAIDVVQSVFDGVIITVVVGETSTPVDLGTLDRTTFQDKEAVRLTRIVEMAAMAKPWGYHYNFVANDDFDVLRDKLEGDFSQLPYYGELDSGFVYHDADGGMFRIGWDASLGFPKSLNVKGIDGGTIRAVGVGATDVVVKVGAVRTRVDISGMPTQDVVNYKRPDEGPQPMIPLTDVLTAAGVEAPEGFVFKYYATDGFSNNDDNLMPYSHLEHTWLQVANRRVVPEEGWDTSMCCWSVKDTVLILGLVPQVTE